jgi:sensor c-di-GMP phosphodiesterase-like protein
MVVRGLTRRNIVAVAIGVLLAGTPSIAFDFWLGGFIDRQGQAEVANVARRAVALADTRLNQAVIALDAMAKQGVNACRPGDVEAMRRAVFGAATIKAIAVLSPGGQTLCNDLELPLGEGNLVASEALPGGGGISLDVMHLANAPTMVRLRRKAGTGPNEIAVLVPVTLLLPQMSVAGNPIRAYAQLATRGGTLIGATGARPIGADAHFTVKATSDRFRLDAEIVAPRALVPAVPAGLKWLSVFATGAVVLIMGVFAMLKPRRPTGNPVADMARALDAGEFVPYYQPIVDIRTGQLRGAEVLVRWRKPDGSLVLPGVFIPLAESSGLIREMTHDLMRRVCAEAGASLGRRPALKISFNFAGKLFGDVSIVKDVRNIFSKSPIKLSQVVLEVTERDQIENFTVTRQTVAALQELGIRIAIDDVGTGHSGLSYMLKLGVDIIKIDKMFVDAIGTDRNSATIVETLVDLAHNMRMDVVAEGVENFEQVVHLRDLGIRAAQGYVFAPPLPGSAFLQLVEAIDPLPAAEPAAAKTESRQSAA